jgi:hypothetical protein
MEQVDARTVLRINPGASSLLFPGYMEGGLHSGATLAKRLARKSNLV